MGKSDYGIWLTIFSICNWISYLDGGFGNGLRNELTFHLVKDQRKNAQQVISTAYISIFIFLLGLYLILVLLHGLFDWNVVVNSSEINFNILALFVFGFFMLQMVLKIIGKIYFSFNRSYMSFLIPMLSNATILGLVMLCYYVDIAGKFWNVAYVYAFSPLLILILISLHFFKIVKPDYAPTLSGFDKKYVGIILKNGALFFLIQMSSGLLQAITPIFITQWFSPDLTAEYQVAVKYYSFTVIFLNIILQTMWTSISQFYINKDGQKLKLLFKRKLMIAAVLIVLLVLMYLVSTFVYKIWISRDFEISPEINLAAFLFIFAIIVSSIFTNFLNATNNIRIQGFLSVLIVLCYFPVAYLLVKVLDLGVTSLIFAPALFFGVQMVVALIELRKVIFGKKQLQEVNER